MAVTKDKKGVVTFICDSAPSAKRVFLAGDFNGWDPKARRMVRVKDGSFRAKYDDLASGEHQYKFVVDGKWTTDPTAESSISDGCGGTNSVACI